MSSAIGASGVPGFGEATGALRHELLELDLLTIASVERALTAWVESDRGRGGRSDRSGAITAACGRLEEATSQVWPG